MPVVPPALRRVVGVLVVVCAAWFVVLAVLHHGTSAPDRVERAVSDPLQAAWPDPGPFFYAVDGLVTLVPVVVTLALLALLAVLTGQRRLALLALAGPLGVAAATTLLKPVVDRTIHGENLSFPSGHTGYATAVGLVVGLGLAGLARRASTAARSVLLLAPAALASVVMAFDQITLDAHYPGDTLGGVLTAVVVTLVGALLLDRLLDLALPRLTARRGALEPRSRTISARPDPNLKKT